MRVEGLFLCCKNNSKNNFKKGCNYLHIWYYINVKKSKRQEA
nr:MAG TPA: hypothetical protein [Caudoviricetes sp.]